MALAPVELWYDILLGQNSQHTNRVRQDRNGLEFSQASNVIPDPPGELVTSPGFSKVNSQVITSSPSITGIHHLGSLADKFVVNTGNGKIYDVSTATPSEITGGTAFTSGDNVLIRGDIANDVLILVSNERDTVQQINSALTRTDLAGTPPKGVDYKYFARRGCMFAPDVSGTIHRMKMIFNDKDDTPASWLNPTTFNFLNFGREGSGVTLLGGERFMDHLIGFTNDDAFPIYATPSSDLPMQFQDSVLTGTNGGPSSINGVVAGDDGSLYWISRGFDVKRMRPDKVIDSIGFPVQPFLRGLNNSRRQYIVGGWEPRYRMVVWSVSDGSDTTHQDTLLYHPELKAYYFRTLKRNAFGQREVSGEARLIGGGYAGFLYNEFDSSTTGNLDDATAVIDADLQTGRLHLGMPGIKKKVPYVAIEFDPIGTEVITVQYQLDDSTSWTSFAESTYTMSGTDTKIGRFTIPRPFELIKLRIRDNNSGERYRATRIGFPRPKSVSVSR